MTAAQLGKRVSKQGSSQPIRYMRAAVQSRHQLDCEEKRDPDEYNDPEEKRKKKSLT